MSQPTVNFLAEAEQDRAGVSSLLILIGGEWRQSASTKHEDVINPAYGTVLTRVPLSTADDVNAAVRAAAQAFPAWRNTPVPQRVQVLFRLKYLLEDNFEELARLVTLENGKCIDDGRGEVRRGIEVVDFACGMPTLIMGETVEQIASGIDSHTVRVPLGVCAGICPFNFPAMIPLWMMPIAIAAGNTFVLKPSERTPMSATRIAELFVEAGLPAGVLNVVHGAKETVDSILAHPDIRAVSFVGSMPVAKYIYETAAKQGKRVQALAGAKNHLVVMPDCDMDLTIKAILSSSFGAAGQRCLAGSVMVAVGDAADKLLPRLIDEAGNMRIGDGLMQDSALGPVIRGDTCNRVERYIDKGLAEGAELVLDGREAARDKKDGFFIGASIFDRATPEMSIAQDEIFGPLLAVVRVKDLDDALAVTNRSRFGNASSIFTRSGEAARQFRSRVEAGMCGVNIGVAAPMAFFPFAGWKNSFFGDLHATGKDGVKFYTETRVVIERW
jgi:malonate-semialdehyde dehydrogenase (acetylating) / methylmalonate-semialdehyde dehydrogenase